MKIQFIGATHEVTGSCIGSVNYRLPAWAGGQWRDCYLGSRPTPPGGQPDSKAKSTKYVIARRAKAERPTWQSPGTIHRFV